MALMVSSVLSIWYFSRKNRNTSSRNDDDDEEEYFETRHYNSYGA